MNWEAIGASAEVLGVVAILVSLFYVAIQIRQNNNQLNQQSYQTWVASHMSLNMATLDPSRAEMFTRGFTDSADLSEDSWIAFAYWNNGVMQMAQAVDYLYRSGSLDKSLWESEIQRAALILALPGVSQWWNAGGRTQFTPEFVNLIESTECKMTPFNWEEGRGFIPFVPSSSGE